MYKIDRMIESIDAAMKTLRDSMLGIPFRPHGFKSKHDQLARAAATLTVTLDAARTLHKSE